MAGRKVIWSHPAFAHKHMFARNDHEIICVELSPEGQLDTAIIEDQEAIAAAIVKLKGSVQVDAKEEGKPIRRVDLRRTAVTDKDLAVLGRRRCKAWYCTARPSATRAWSS